MRINLTTYGGIRTFMAIGLDATFHCKKAKWLMQKAQITKCLIGVIANFWPLFTLKPNSGIELNNGPVILHVQLD